MENFITVTDKEYVENCDIPSVNCYVVGGDKNRKAVAEKRFGIVLVRSKYKTDETVYEVYFDSPESMTKYVMSK